MSRFADWVVVAFLLWSPGVSWGKGTSGVGGILLGLKSKVALEREHAMAALKKKKLPVAQLVPVLVKMLKDPKPYLRQAAAKHLGELGPKALAAAPALAVMLDAKERKSRKEAVLALRKLGPQIAPVLLARAQKGKVFPRYPFVAGATLYRMGPAVWPTVASGLSHRSALVRRLCMYALSTKHILRPKIFAKVMHTIQKEPSLYVRYAALWILAQAGLKAKAATPILLARLRQEKNPSLRFYILGSLGFVAPKEKAIPVLLKFLQGSNLEGRKEALDGLGRLGKGLKPVHKALEKCAAKEGDPLQSSCFRLLVKFATPQELLPGLLAALQSKTLQREALDVLKRKPVLAREKALVPVLKKLLWRSSSRTFGEILGLLRKGKTELLPLLQKALRAKHLGRSGAALKFVAKLEPSHAVKTLPAMMKILLDGDGFRYHGSVFMAAFNRIGKPGVKAIFAAYPKHKFSDVYLRSALKSVKLDDARFWVGLHERQKDPALRAIILEQIRKQKDGDAALWVGLLKHKEPAVQKVALSQLERLKDAKGISEKQLEPRLLAFLRAKDVSFHGYAASLLRKFRYKSKEVLGALLGALKMRNSPQWSVLEALMSLYPSHFEALRYIASLKNPYVAYKAIKRFKVQIKPILPQLFKRAKERLRGFAKMDSSTFRYAWMQGVRPALTLLLCELFPNHRQFRGEVLYLRKLVTLRLDGDRHSDVRDLVGCIQRIARKKDLPVLEKALQKPDEKLRVNVSVILGGCWRKNDTCLKSLPSCPYG